MSDERRILVIDEDEEAHSSIRRILSRLSFKVESASNPEEGLNKIRSANYDAVITELIMSQMSGLELLEAMRKMKPGVPAIVITRRPTIKTALQALRLGAVDYIPKPFTRAELLGPLNRALMRGEARIADSESAEEKTPSMPPGDVEPLPGDRFRLPNHSWVVYNQDGTADIGVESSFLDGIPGVTDIVPPLENDLVEQGYPGFRLRTGEDVHAVTMPLSGRVVGVNEMARANPSALNADTWVIRIIPSQLADETSRLSRCAK